MLVLSRCPREGICIGEHVRVFVIGFKGRQVLLGFEAPPQIPIDRLEIRERKRPGSAQRRLSLQAQRLSQPNSRPVLSVRRTQSAPVGKAAVGGENPKGTREASPCRD